MDTERWFRRFAAEGPVNAGERGLKWLLLPLSWLYALIALVRLRLYRSGVFKAYRAAVPVISVGNLAVGGTGKTPTVDWLLRYLHKQGLRAAVVSRGYGGSLRAGVGVVGEGRGGAPLLAATLCGDEPYLLARRNPQAVVLVARRRRDGVALAVTHYEAEIVLLDDGFQHHDVVRDLDIVLLDAQRPFGNGSVLPAGLLREAPRAIRRGDLVILTRSVDMTEMHPLLPASLLHGSYRLSSLLYDLAGRSVPLATLAGRRGLAFAGIAEPDGFFAGVQTLGIALSARVALPDHAVYDAAALARLTAAAAQHQADFFVTTEKDGVKLAGVSLPLPCYQASLELVFDRPERIEEAVTALLRKDT